MSYRLLQGDVLDRLRELPADSVHCCVTSPPYWSLRDYGVAGQIGLEATPELFIERLVEVFREVRRVLRSDGTCWVNMGDAYANSGLSGGTRVSEERGQLSHRGAQAKGRVNAPGLKPKDLIGQPWMLAFALRADGWWLRQEIIWHKPNPMPESVGDRCTKAHEQIFLLTKSERYFYDVEAVKERSVWTLPAGGGTGVGFGRGYDDVEKPRYSSGNKARKHGAERGCPEGTGSNVCSSVPWEGNTRNKRSVWTIPTEAFAEAHFATFPTELVKPCIMAGTSEVGCCEACGAPVVRQVQPSERYAQALGKGYTDHTGDLVRGMQQLRGTNRQNRARDEFGTHSAEYITIGWLPSCACSAAAVPCTVLDPFNGSGTTGVVAQRLGREYIGIELNPEYCTMAERRLKNFHQRSQPRKAKGEDHVVAPLFAAAPADDVEQAGAA